MNLSELTVPDLYQLEIDIHNELWNRRADFVARTMLLATITRAEADEYAEKGRSVFALPLGDWALVRTAIADKQAELARRGCVQFMPIVYPTPETITDEYRLLYPEKT